MTREQKPAAPSAARRAASLLTGALMIAGLSGCSGGGLFQISDSTNLDQKTKPPVALAATQGVPDKHLGKLNEQLAASVKSKGIVVVEAKDAQYVVRVTYAALRDGKLGTKLTYAIDVTDKTGNKVRQITGEENVSAKHGGDPWSHVTDEGLQKVALRSATDLNAWLENPNAPPPAAVAAAPAPAPAKTAAARPAAKVAAVKPAPEPSLAAASDPAAPAPPVQTPTAAPAQLVAIVTPVSGAPGDGKTSLSEAMKRALSRQGIKIASAGHGAYKIQGQVELTPAANNEQSITIRWVVLDPSGKQMEKTVVQKNNIAAGSLDKAWGETADQAAGAAASEVLKLLNKPTGQAQASNGSAG